MKPWIQLAADTPGGRLLRRAWQPVYRAMDLLAGNVVRVRVLGQDYALFRHDGGVGLLADRCPHRGTRLSLGSVVDSALRCAHHGWAWDGEGQPAPGHAAQTSVCAGAVPVQEAHGLLFAWFGDGAPPALPVLDGVWTAMQPNRWPCSFFRRLENTVDLAHVPHSHRLSGVGAGFPDTLTGQAAPFEGGLDVVEGEARVRFYVPNVLQFGSPTDAGFVEHVVWRVPEGVDSCRSFMLAKAALDTAPRRFPFDATPVENLAEEVLEGRRTLESLRGHHSLTEIEDYVVLVGQGPMEQQPPESLGPADAPVRALRRAWREALDAPAAPLEIRPL